MAYGETKREDWQNLITVRPGPTIHVWRGGADYCQVPLTQTAALTLIMDLTVALRMAGFGATLPNESLPVAEHIARREAERGAVDWHPGAIIGSNDE